MLECSLQMNNYKINQVTIYHFIYTISIHLLLNIQLIRQNLSVLHIWDD